MHPRVRIMLLLGLSCWLFSLGLDAAAQTGRLLGTVAYTAPGASPVVARGVRVIAAGDYEQFQARTDNNGNFLMVLRPGTYNVVAQGAPGFVTYRASLGYVRAYTDSIITPNPIYLVPASSSSIGLPTFAFGQTVAWSGYATGAYQNSLMSEIAPQGYSTGSLYGVVKIDLGKDRKGKDNVELARFFRVDVEGGYDKTQTHTGSDGVFVTPPLPAGQYKITVKKDGYYQTTEAWGTVVVKEHTAVSPNPIWLKPN